MNRDRPCSRCSKKTCKAGDILGRQFGSPLELASKVCTSSLAGNPAAKDVELASRIILELDGIRSISITTDIILQLDGLFRALKLAVHLNHISFADCLQTRVV